jgi:hypothetical protein
MTQQELIQWMLGLGVMGVGWFARMLWAAVQELKEDLSKLREDLPIYYVRKDDFREFRHNVMDALARIEGLLSGKADK